MSLSVRIHRSRSNSVCGDQDSGRSSKPSLYLAKWSIVVAEARAFFSRLSRNSQPVQTLPSEMTALFIDQRSGPFVAKENFKRGADVVIFGDELYKWRDEFNIPPTLIALRDISSGEEVISDPANFESSDLMPHWAQTWAERK